MGLARTVKKGRTTYDSVDYLLLRREVDVLNNRMRLGKCDDWATKDRRLHSATHHGVAEKSLDTGVRVTGFGVTEIFLESLHIHGILSLEESEVWKHPGGSADFSNL